MEVKRELCITYAETPAEKGPITAFVDAIYLAAFQTTPPVPDVYAAVSGNGKILACIGIEWPGTDGILAIERTYHITRSSLPRPLTAENGMQYGRWTSTDRQAAMAAVYAATYYGLARGKQYGLVEHDAAVHRLSLRFGFEFWDVEHTTPDIETIRPENRDFYARSRMKPYLVELPQIRDTLARRTTEALLSLRGLDEIPVRL